MRPVVPQPTEPWSSLIRKSCQASAMREPRRGENPMTMTFGDDITSGPKAGTTRRAITRLLGGLALGAPLALLGLNETRGKGKSKPKHKKKQDTPNVTTVNNTVRQPLTQTFRNSDPITIPGDKDQGVASPYPSLIDVTGFTNGRILDVNLTIHGFSHGF